MAKAEKRAITMSDSRVVNFGKSEKVKKEILRADNGAPKGIRFDGDNGETFVADFEELPHAEWIGLAEPDGVEVWAMAHGFNQKLGDSYAGADHSADCIESARQVWGRLTKGQWQSENRGFGASAVLLEAVCRAYPQKSRDENRAILAGLSKAERDSLQLAEPIKSHYEAVLRERTKGDATDLIAKFQ